MTILGRCTALLDLATTDCKFSRSHCTMFGIFSAKPPLSTRQRAELELLMRKCVDRIGAARVRECQVICQGSELPLDLTSPDSLLATATAEVRRRMHLTEASVTIQVSDVSTLEAAACYQIGPVPTISVAAETLADPLRTVTALAHEFGHLFWLAGEDVKPADFDEWLTDLLPVCYGFGILQSDASLYFENWSVGEWSGYQASRHGYLNAQQIGYALALFARVRGEDNPPWARWLRADSKATLKQAWKHFHKREGTADGLLFDAERIPGVESTQKELASWLCGDDPTFALAAAWRLCGIDHFEAATLDALHQATHSSDEDVVPVVIGLLAGADERDQRTTERITRLMSDQRPQVALTAAKAATALGLPMDGQAGALAWLLDKYQADPRGVLAVIQAQGSEAAMLDANVCRMIPRSLKSLDDDRTVALIECLKAISPDPAKSIESVISPGPIRDEAIEWLARN